MTTLVSKGSRTLKAMGRVHVCVWVAANVFVAQGYFIRRMPTARKRAPTLGAAKICAAPALCRRGARGIAARGQVRPLAAASTGVKPGAVGPMTQLTVNVSY